jgi:hypothetical protein
MLRTCRKRASEADQTIWHVICDATEFGDSGIPL